MRLIVMPVIVPFGVIQSPVLRLVTHGKTASSRRGVSLRREWNRGDSVREKGKEYV